MEFHSFDFATISNFGVTSASKGKFPRKKSNSFESSAVTVSKVQRWRVYSTTNSPANNKKSDPNDVVCVQLIPTTVNLAAGL